MYRRSLFVIGMLVTLCVAGANVALAGDGSLPAEWQAVRAAAARYHSFDQAQQAGYSVADEPCVSAPGLGTMGIHAVNPALLQSGVIDPLQPPILLYVPRDNGSLKLVGVEYFAVALANTENGPAPWFGAQDEPPPLGFFNPAPSLFGQTFDGPMAGHNPSMPWHYDLHAWITEVNPAGVNAQFNPTLSCG